MTVEDGRGETRNPRVFCDRFCALPTCTGRCARTRPTCMEGEVDWGVAGQLTHMCRSDCCCGTVRISLIDVSGTSWNDVGSLGASGCWAISCIAESGADQSTFLSMKCHIPFMSGNLELAYSLSMLSGGICPGRTSTLEVGGGVRGASLRVSCCWKCCWKKARSISPYEHGTLRTLQR